MEMRFAQIHETLSAALLREANEHGYRARIEATELHAPTAAGTLHWHAVLYQVRLALAALGWNPLDQQNCPFIVSPDRQVAIAVMTGDADTGLEMGSPTNQASKGKVLREAVDRNRQLEMFDPATDPATVASLAKSKGATQLWILLYHVAVGVDGKPELRAELSSPLRFARKKIVEWSERLILEAIRPESEPFMDQDSPTGPIEPTGPIDVPVERRTGTQ
ncbi:hypothetical protein WU00_30635 [Burkholderia stagnalis]|nr:hypothetical protein WT48_14850 [Burkholderia stagnalis]KWO82953.1 hypothetical protein WU00_30635 [Burkholderia stagnalis]